MAVVSLEDIKSRIMNFNGTNTDDDYISIMEDVTDTFSDISPKIDDMEKIINDRVAEKDREWRERYTARFRDGFTLENKDESASGSSGMSNNVTPVNAENRIVHIESEDQVEEPEDSVENLFEREDSEE